LDDIWDINEWWSDLVHKEGFYCTFAAGFAASNWHCGLVPFSAIFEGTNVARRAIIVRKMIAFESIVIGLISKDKAHGKTVE
jgi:hypothetical protein